MAFHYRALTAPSAEKIFPFKISNPVKIQLKTNLIVTALAIANLVPAQLLAYDFPGKGDRQVWLQACDLSNQCARLFQNAQYEEAFKGFQKSIEFYPYDAVLVYNVGLAHQQYAYIVNSIWSPISLD